MSFMCLWSWLQGLTCSWPRMSRLQPQVDPAPIFVLMPHSAGQRCQALTHVHASLCAAAVSG